MVYQKTINLFDNTLNQSSKFKTKNQVETTDDSQGVYTTNSQIKFKTSMLRSSLCGYSDVSMLIKEIITLPNTAARDAARNNRNKKVIFKNHAPFTNCTSEIKNAEIDHAKDNE